MTMPPDAMKAWLRGVSPMFGDMAAQLQMEIALDIITELVLIGQTDCSHEKFMKLAGEAKYFISELCAEIKV